MRMDPIHIENKHQLIQDYRYGRGEVSSFFDYHPFKSFQQRVADLQNRTFKRDELSHVLQMMNKQWTAPDSTMKNIERLKNKQSVVVIGGQQAGIMTGPLYTINKVISLIHCAKEQEKKLNIPVIPVFWIAGEDHDYDEINHVFLMHDHEMTKYKAPQHVMKKTSISNITIDQTKVENWVKQLFATLPETDHTKHLYEVVKDCLKKSTTYVDFFAHLIYRLFPDEGIVLVDSDHKQLRNLESDYFVQMIQKQPEFAKAVHETQEKLNSLGYNTPLDVVPEDAHLFVHADDERILLKRDEAGGWIGKQKEIKLTTDEMLDMAVNAPDKLSNNVITRPLMQELIFPSLAFVGGNGEIRYWAALRKAFHILDMSMPPVLPRLSLTYVPRNIESLLKEWHMEASQAINKDMLTVKESWMNEQGDERIEQTSHQLKKAVSTAHEPLRQLAEEIRVDIGDLAEKNLAILHKHIDFLKKRMERELQQKYCHQLGQLDMISAVLRPQNGLQERVWNILPFINMYGFEFLQNICNTSYSFEEEHYIVFL